MRHGREGGYVGLIALIISVAIIGLLFARMYLEPKGNPNAEFQPLTASGTVPQTGMDQMHADVDAANAIKDELNKKNAEAQVQIDQQ